MKNLSLPDLHKAVHTDHKIPKESASVRKVPWTIKNSPRTIAKMHDFVSYNMTNVVISYIINLILLVRNIHLV